MVSPVHVLMLSIQAVLASLLHLRAPGIVPFLQATPLFPHGVTTASLL